VPRSADEDQLLDFLSGSGVAPGSPESCADPNPVGFFLQLADRAATPQCSDMVVFIASLHQPDQLP